MGCCIGHHVVEGEGGGEGGRDPETVPIINHKQVHEHFRATRNQDVSRWIERMKCVLKWSANCLGIWKPRRWGLVVSIVFAAVCIYQLVYDLLTVLGCKGFDCGFLKKEQAETRKVHRNSTASHAPYRKTANTVYTLASTGGFLSYIFLLICLLKLERKRDCALAPSEALRDLSRTHAKVLFASFAFMTMLFLTGVGFFYYIVRNQPKDNFFIEMSTGVGCQFIAQGSAIVACIVFGISSFGLGK